MIIQMGWIAWTVMQHTLKLHLRVILVNSVLVVTTIRFRFKKDHQNRFVTLMENYQSEWKSIWNLFHDPWYCLSQQPTLEYSSWGWGIRKRDKGTWRLELLLLVLGSVELLDLILWLCVSVSDLPTQDRILGVWIEPWSLSHGNADSGNDGDDEAESGPPEIQSMSETRLVWCNSRKLWHRTTVVYRNQGS